MDAATQGAGKGHEARRIAQENHVPRRRTVWIFFVRPEHDLPAPLAEHFRQPFAIANGANEHTAELNIADYAEFHIHVGTSMVNLYKATIGETASA